MGEGEHKPGVLPHRCVLEEIERERESVCASSAKDCGPKMIEEEHAAADNLVM